MQGRGGGRNPFFDPGDPFGGFGGFGSFGPPRSLFSSVFGGRDPFDDPFFTQPFGGMFQSSPFGGPAGFPFPPDIHQPSGFIEHQAPEPTRGRGPIIQELNSDDENEDATEERKANPRKHSRSSKEPFVEHPEDELGGKKSRHLSDRNEYNRSNVTVHQPQPQPQSHSFCFQSSTVSYGGADGTYYSSSRTRRTGSDGVAFEESKEADSSTRQASHTISRGLHSKGHTLARKLNSDGKVDTMQTLHNINEDELAGFEEEWKGKGQKCLPGWNGSIGASHSGQAEQARIGGRMLPSSEHIHPAGTAEVRGRVASSHMPERVRTVSNDRGAYLQGGRGLN